MKRILSQLKQGKSFLLFIGFKTLAEAISFIIPLVVAKVLIPEMFGAFSLFKMILFLGIAVFIGPLMTPLNIESNKELSKTKKSNKTFTSSLVYSFFSVSFFLLIYLFFGKELISFTGLDYNEFKYVFLLAFFGLAIKSFLSNFFISQDNKNLHVFVELFYNSLLIFSIFILYKLEVLTMYNIFLSFFISGVLTLVVSLFFIDYKKILPLSFSSENFKTIAHFSLWVTLGYTSSYLINWGDNIVLRYFVSLEEIGIYNFAYQVFKGFIMVSFMISTYFTPFISQNINDKKKMNLYYFNKRVKILFLSFFFFFLINFFLNLFIRFFYSDYLNSIILIQILSIGAFCSFYHCFLIPFYNSAGLYKISQLLLLSQVIINILLDILLIPFLGILGAAIATAISYLLFTSFYTFYFYKKIKPIYLDL